MVRKGTNHELSKNLGRKQKKINAHKRGEALSRSRKDGILLERWGGLTEALGTIRHLASAVS